QEALNRLYGPVTTVGRPVSAYIGCSSNSKGGTARCAFSLYWGNNSRKNSAYSFEGKQSEARGSLFAILQAVINSPQSQTLIIYTSSQYAIRSLCYWAADNEMMGWPCAHGDVLDCTVNRIRARTAPVEF
ncbi:hypothetical protein C8R43DRAFT_866952, partial [Mycena crocata]